MDIREQLQNTLGSAYTLDRELGGGGMSRVFVAQETALGRMVVIKVLPPELVQNLSVNRFKREIQLAAQLQHPHIVPVHSAGETDGLPYYTMPLVEGTSLRSRLSKTGPLPISETISILRDVAKALTYAHERGVVHRDIKPDNVLMTGGAAVVTDFGIAKALSLSKTDAPGGTLTQMGTSIGTPAYMAPEQAAADPSTDHRADLYSFGCMAYEMLSGQPPFTAKTPHKLLAAHMGEPPRPITELRGDTPADLAALVMHLLAKDPDHRPQSAHAVLKVLDSATSGGGHAAMPPILLAGRPRLLRALALYAIAFVAAWVLARAAVVGIGLPTWFVPATMIAMALGLPVILFTAFVHHGAHQVMTNANLTPGGTPVAHSTMTRLAVRASPWVTWRRTVLGGVASVAVVAIAVAIYMVMRAAGIGPVGSLMASGAFSESERLLIADFKSPVSDSSLGPVVTDAFRSDLAQSKSLVVVQPTIVRQVLVRMQKPANTPVNFALAREVAAREGIKAVIDGEVLAIGNGYVINATMYAAQTGEQLATFRTTAKDADAIIPAISELSRDVRAKVGESLRTVNAAVPLEQVTTGSLEALKKYVAGTRVFSEGGDFGKGIALLDEAVAIDTGFAMAYRKIGIELLNRGTQPQRRFEVLQKAYDHRERLSDAERYLTTAAYFTSGPVEDNSKAISAYEALLEIDPRNVTAMNNLSVAYRILGQKAKAEEYAARAEAIDPRTRNYYLNQIDPQIGLGKFEEAERTLERFVKNVPNAADNVVIQARLQSVRGRYDTAEAILRAGLVKRGTERAFRRTTTIALADLARLHGKLREAKRLSDEARVVTIEQNATIGTARGEITSMSNVAGWFYEDTARARRLLDSALARYPLTEAPIDRPYVGLARLAAQAGQPQRARAFLAGYDSARRNLRRRADSTTRKAIQGSIAVAENQYAEAVRYFRQAETPGCRMCGLPDLAHAMDLAGQTDSAIVVMEEYANLRNDYGKTSSESFYLAGIHKRLGELYENRNEPKKAAAHYSAFIELWKNADPELQPKVAEARRRLERLRAGETK